MPLANEHICFSDSFGFFSSNNSGKTVTKAMCKNPPAVNGKIHEVRGSENKINSSEIAHV